MGEITIYEPGGDLDVAIVIGTYGLPEWEDRAHVLAQYLTRHLDFAQPQKIIVSNAQSLATARNDGAAEAGTEWLVFLDADDDLDNEFFQRADRAMGFDCEIVKVAVRGFNADGYIDPYPILGADFPFLYRNHLTIGCPVKTEMWKTVGGFDDEYPCLEDWAFWMKCDLAGARIRKAQDAVYLIGDNHKRSEYPDAFSVAVKIRTKFRVLYEERG